MSFDWSHFLDLAERLQLAAERELADSGVAEAELRTAISRAYYSAFHQARSRYSGYWVDSLPEHRKRSSHANVIAAYAAKEPYVGDSEAKRAVGQVVDSLTKLRLLRQAADYASVVPRIKRSAAIAIIDARLIETALTKLVR